MLLDAASGKRLCCLAHISRERIVISQATKAMKGERGRGRINTKKRERKRGGRVKKGMSTFLED